MCTLVILHRPGQDWPLILAGNRDEMKSRPTSPPARHWPDHPDIIAGLDQLGGGTWLGLNRDGVCSVIMNREGTLGPAEGKRSRGELVLQALRYPGADEASDAIADINPADYRAFNLVIGDRHRVYWLRNRDEGKTSGIEVTPIEPGLHMLASRELDDTAHPRIARWLPRFRETPFPEPGRGEWRHWQDLLAAREEVSGGEPHAAMNMDLSIGFATVSTTLLALPEATDHSPIWLYADGPPDRVPFNAIALT